MSGLSTLANPTYDRPPASPLEDELAADVRDDFIQAEHYRRISGVEERMLRSLRARRYEYDPQDRALIGGVDIYIGLIGLKCRAAESWINDIILNAIDKPWTLKPDPIPELPEWLKEQVVDALQMELQQLGASLDVRKRARELKDTALKYAVQKANDAVQSMETKIEDQLLKGGWRDMWGEFVSDLTTFPTAFFRSPVIQKEKRLSWDGNTLVEKDEIVYGCRRISPFDAFPSLNSTTCQDGTFFIERLRAQPELLYMCLGLEGFNDDAIRLVLEEYGEHGYEEMLRPDYQRMYLEDKYHAANDRKTIDVLIRNGKIVGKKLLKYNIAVPDPQAYYESEVWTVNNRTIKAILNPFPLEQRPIFSTSFVKVPGSLWGEGLPDILRDTQRTINSCARAIVRNLSFSSGPIGEVDVSRLGDGEIPNEIIPYKMFHVDPDLTGGSKPAFVFTQIVNVAPQLMDVMERFNKIADDLSGVPAYVLGNPNVAGAGRTLGGLSMMMGNAAKGIKNVLLNVDRDAIEPSITLRYNMNMKFDEDPEIKGGAQVVARGTTGLLQRELSQARMVELLQTYMPYVQAGLIPPQGAQVMIRESMKNTGLPVDDIIPDPNRANQIETELGSQGVNVQLPGPGLNAMNTGTSAPASLDGRSAPPPFPQTNIPAPTPPGSGSSLNPFPMPTNLPQGA